MQDSAAYSFQISRCDIGLELNRKFLCNLEDLQPAPDLNQLFHDLDAAMQQTIVLQQSVTSVFQQEAFDWMLEIIVSSLERVSHKATHCRGKRVPLLLNLFQRSTNALQIQPHQTIEFALDKSRPR